MHSTLPTRRHYPFVTRMIARLYDEGRLPEVAAVEIEPEYGYVTRITYRNGRHRMTRASDVGLNSAAACEVVRDKAYTKHFLRRWGYDCPAGEAFLLGWWADRLRPRLREHGTTDVRSADRVLAYVADELGYPVYVKPVDGSKGVLVWYCDTPALVERVLALYEAERVRVAVVERAVELPDFRLVVLDDTLISAYQRLPLEVVGNGHASIGELLGMLQVAFRRAGRDTSLTLDDGRIATRLQRSGLTLDSVPAPGRRVPLLDVSNLSTGGTAVDLTATVAPRWRDLAIDIARQFGLRFCGVDLACADLESGAGGYSVIEVNGTPGLDHYGAVGAAQERVVSDLYARVLNTSPE
ncbi:MAG TPA: hypothetical protein VES42_12185 [Pilimelia sp.]|nr:hypothetical protein [Pilimelia sp.]